MMNVARVNILSNAIAAAAMLAGFFAFAPAASAQFSSCATQNPDGSVQCNGANRWCGNTCQANPGVTCAANQVFSCNSCGCVCNTSTHPCGGCTVASSTPNVTTCSNPINGRYTDQCSATCGCASGTQLCAGTNTCVAVISCPAGTAFDPCTGACNSPNILKDQVIAQTAYINISGNLSSSAGNLSVAGMSTLGTASLALSGGQNLVYGNIDTGSTGSLMLLQNESADRFRIDAAGNVTNAGTLTVGGLASDPAGVAGRMYYRTVDNKFRCHNGTVWADCGGGMPAGTASQTMRHNGTAWVANGLLRNDGTAIEIAGTSVSSTDIGTLLTFLRTFDSLSESAGFGARAEFNLGGDTVGSLTGRIISGSGAAKRGGLSFDTRNPNGTSEERLRISTIPSGGLPYRTAVSIGDGTILPGFILDVRQQTNSGTAIVNVSNESTGSLWTGYRIARGAPSVERWFVGMESGNTDLVLRRNGTTNDLTIDGATGKIIVSALQITGGSAPLTGKVLTADVNGNTSWQALAGANVCAGTRKYIGSTAASYDGNGGGYANADTRCEVNFAGSTICTAEEILNSYRCDGPGDPIFGIATGSNWVVAGPPGFTTFSNDCDGWTSNSPTGGYFGRLWTFSGTTYGKATVATCDNSLKYACCK